MTETLYKGVRPDGTDFYTGTVQWAPEKTKARKGRVVRHPTSTMARKGDFATFLSASTDPANLPGSSWPLRLLEVEPVGELLRVDACKRGATAFRVIREIDPALRFGPMGVYVVALFDRAGKLTADEGSDLDAARYAARYAAGDAAWDAAWDAARDAAWGAARDAARYAAWDAARALIVRDLIGSHGFAQEHYDLLAGPWRKVIGPIHPEDEDLR